MTSERYKLNEKDIRFLKAVDYVISKHQKFLGARGSESILSSTVFGKRNVISRIRCSSRGVTQKQIEQFATHFDLDFNYFYRENYPIRHLGSKWFEKQETETWKESRLAIDKDGYSYDNIWNNQIYVCIEKARRILKSTPEEASENFSEILDTIHEETQELEDRLLLKANQLKQLEKEHSKTIIDLQNRLIEARNREIALMEKHIAYREGEALKSEIRQNGVGS